MEHKYRADIRNIAIIAHVDHGKTSLVDVLLKQSRVFRENQVVGQFIMDRNALERERGITILAKNTAIMYKGIKINIIDTPGHADFSGEVERVLNMADGVLLLIDAVDGPMPQTRFVLKRAMEKNLKPLVVINKIDRENARIPEVVRLTQDLFLEIATNADQLDYPIIYTSAKEGYAVEEPGQKGENLIPLFDAIVREIPPPVIEDGLFQMLVSNIDYDTHKGRIAIGRIRRGKVAPHDAVVIIDKDGKLVRREVGEVMTYLGLNRTEVPYTEAGEIGALTGLEGVSIGDTIASPDQPEALTRIAISEPTVKMSFGVNTSPLSGREGKYSTSRHLRERLYRELETNLSLRVQDSEQGDEFLVCGRGELHLAVLIETMRREGYELQVSKPEAITKEVNGQIMEPIEDLIIDTRQEYIGELTELVSKRQARLTNMVNDGLGNVRMEYRIPTRGLIGFRSAFLTSTRGSGVMNSIFVDYEPWFGEINSSRSSVLVASEDGVAVSYGLANAQERGIMFIEPGTEVYEGMLVGLTQRGQDLPINVCKEKKMTNVRASTSDIAIKLVPPMKVSLEQALDLINKDELVEITPKNIRLRKKLLTMELRLRARKAGE